MITEFSLDEDFFCSEYLNKVNVPAIHDQLLDNWKKHGVLICKESKIEIIIDAIKQLPPKFHQRWLDALEHYTVSQCTGEWDNFCEYKDFETLTKLSNIFKTALSEESVLKTILATNLGVAYCDTTEFEVVSPSNINESVNFQKSKKESISDIADNSDIADIWDKKFRNLARHSSRIDIIDRYFYNRLLDSVLNRRKTSIQNFIELLSAENRNYKLRIISEGGVINSENMQSLINYFEIRLPKIPNFKKNISSISLLSNDADYFQKGSHERFIRFDNLICNIGVGMQIFESFPIPRTTFSITHIDDTNHNLRLRESTAKKLWSKTLI